MKEKIKDEFVESTQLDESFDRHFKGVKHPIVLFLLFTQIIMVLAYDPHSSKYF